MERFFTISGNLKLVGYVQLDEQPLIRKSSGGNCSFSCRMTFHEFNCLSFYRQKTLVHGRGRYLATRWQEGAVGLLYLMPQGFFAEIVYSTNGTASQYVFAFDAQEQNRCLAQYAWFVQLPAGLLGTE